MTSIGEGAFYDCLGLTSIAIPFSVRSMGAEVFCGCDNLKDVQVIGHFEKPNDWDKNWLECDATVQWIGIKLT